MNRFRKDIEEDIAEVFLDTDDFAQNVVIDGATVPGLFFRDTEAVLEGSAVDGVDCLIARRSDVPDGRPAISVDGVPYAVVKIEDDHSGMVKIYLSKENRPRF